MPRRCREFLYLAGASLLPVFSVSCDRAGSDHGIATDAPPLVRHDKDGDGLLSDDERAAMNQVFLERFDADKDGKLDAEERSALRGMDKLAVTVAKPLPVTEEQATAFVARLDGNGDGFLSAEDLDGPRWAAVSKADRDGDGKVTAAEWVAFLAP